MKELGHASKRKKSDKPELTRAMKREQAERERLLQEERDREKLVEAGMLAGSAGPSTPSGAAAGAAGGGVGGGAGAAGGPATPSMHMSAAGTPQDAASPDSSNAADTPSNL